MGKRPGDLWCSPGLKLWPAGRLQLHRVRAGSAAQRGRQILPLRVRILAPTDLACDNRRLFRPRPRQGDRIRLFPFGSHGGRHSDRFNLAPESIFAFRARRGDRVCGARQSTGQPFERIQSGSPPDRQASGAGGLAGQKPEPGRFAATTSNPLIRHPGPEEGLEQTADSATGKEALFTLAIVRRAAPSGNRTVVGGLYSTRPTCPAAKRRSSMRPRRRSISRVSSVRWEIVYRYSEIAQRSSSAVIQSMRSKRLRLTGLE